MGKAVNETQNSIYTDKELQIMETAQNVRSQIVTSMVKGGIPDRVGDIRVLNEVLTANEKSAHDSATNRLKFQDNENKEATLEIVAETLKQVNINRQNLPKTNLTIDADLKNIETVPGEIEIDVDRLELEDFTGDNNGS